MLLQTLRLRLYYLPTCGSGFLIVKGDTLLLMCWLSSYFFSSIHKLYCIGHLLSSMVLDHNFLGNEWSLLSYIPRFPFIIYTFLLVIKYGYIIQTASWKELSKYIHTASRGAREMENWPSYDLPNTGPLLMVLPRGPYPESC